jgi:transcriptional regulator with GAF, ATPase, and Fis domain
MTARTVAEAFADAAARLTGGVDTSGDLVALLDDCTALLDTASAGLLVDVPGEGLALLSSTSHATDVLELYELQNGRGPCLQAVRDKTTVTAVGSALNNRWEPVGPAIIRAGYHGVHAFPLRWRDQAVGALNLFATHDRTLGDDQIRLGQAFADIAVAVLAQTQPAPWEHLHHRVNALLHDRVAIEQAKGVVAVQHRISLSDAYTWLVTASRQQNLPLSDLATRVLASTRTTPP